MGSELYGANTVVSHNPVGPTGHTQTARPNLRACVLSHVRSVNHAWYHTSRKNALCRYAIMPLLLCLLSRIFTSKHLRSASLGLYNGNRMHTYSRHFWLRHKVAESPFSINQITNEMSGYLVENACSCFDMPHYLNIALERTFEELVSIAMCAISHIQETVTNNQDISGKSLHFLFGSASIGS